MLVTILASSIQYSQLARFQSVFFVWGICIYRHNIGNFFNFSIYKLFYQLLVFFTLLHILFLLHIVFFTFMLCWSHQYNLLLLSPLAKRNYLTILNINQRALDAACFISCCCSFAYLQSFYSVSSLSCQFTFRLFLTWRLCNKQFILSVAAFVVCAISSLFRLLLHLLSVYCCYVVGHRTTSQQWAVEGLSMYHQRHHDSPWILSGHICRSYRPTE